ncbi:hypothetical protein SAMD00023353_3301000 [Rosellinia necatrix]|uniref:Uncharacterized protein n=1 Tax=Rosellinia necatrix TaxID=77044 RepID=A0A1W2TK51_ROSNE|nr:hypothetical protein SAMD00023353_3301000 [Rosellinia necatrix]
MYSPYGSYSSMSATAQPLDITPNSYFSRDAAYNASCAFPSWPQRSSLMEYSREERATSYLSDDDLFPCDPVGDDAQSISSGSSTASASPFVSEEELLELQRQRAAMQREAIKHLLSEKERRRQQYKRTRKSTGGSSSSSGSKKSSKSKDQMAPITETGE